MADVIYVMRSLLRSKWLTMTVVVTLALGIGSAAAIFSAVDATLFRRTAFASDLYMIVAKAKAADSVNPLINAQYEAFRQLPVFQETAYSVFESANIVVNNEPVGTYYAAASSNLLSINHAQPIRGRWFSAEECQPGKNDVVVIDERMWDQYFNRRPDILGQTLKVGKQVCTVIGVVNPADLPPYFQQPIFRPHIVKAPTVAYALEMRFVLVRLADGTSREAAEAAIRGVHLNVDKYEAQYVEQQRVSLVPAGELGSLARPEVYWTLVCAVFFLYLVAVLNASTLLLLRSLSRSRELSIRLALGGGRLHVLRQLAIEGLLLAILGGAGAWLIAQWIFPVLMQPVAGNGNTLSWSPDLRTGVVMVGLVMFTCVVTLWIPALRILRLPVANGLKDAGPAHSDSRGAARARNTFIVLQSAFAAVLLIGTGLMSRTFHRLESLDLGFQVRDTLKLGFMFPFDRPMNRDERLASLGVLQDKLRVLPGVKAAAFGNDVMMTGEMTGDQVQGADASPIPVRMTYVGRDYPATAGLRVLRGRWLTGGSEVVITETMARVRFGTSDPLGQLIRPIDAKPDHPGWLVVGVVHDIRGAFRESPKPQIFAPESWAPWTINSFAVRYEREPLPTDSSALKRALYEYDPEIIVWWSNSVQDWLNTQLWAERFTFTALRMLGSMAIVLTAVGMFSAMAYAVDRRMNEFGIRLALGALPTNLVVLVLKTGLRLVALGVAFGIAASLALTRFIQSLLFETSPTEPLVFVGVVALLVATTCAACALPAVRAKKADVMRLLRTE